MVNAENQYRQVLKRLKDYCNQKGETFYSLSKKTGLSTSSLSNLLAGKTKPYVYTLILICNALEIPLSTIFEESENVSSEEQEIVESYRIMGTEKRKLLRIYIEMLLQYKKIK